MGNKTECLEEVLLENRADVDSVEPDGSVLRVAVSLGREVSVAPGHTHGVSIRPASQASVTRPNRPVDVASDSKEDVVLMEVKPRDMENFVECNTEAKNSLQSLKDTELPDFNDTKPWHDDVAYYLRNASSVGSI